MPTLQLTVPEDDLNSDEKEELIERLTETATDFYSEVKGEEVGDFVMVQIRETAEGGYALGGEIIG